MPTKKAVVDDVVEEVAVVSDEVMVENPKPPVGLGVYVARKIVKLREKVKEIKPQKMEQGRLKYNYLGERDMTMAIRPVMQELGLVAIPLASSQRTCSWDLGNDKDGNPRKVLLTEVSKTYRVIDTETGDHLDISAEGSGADPMDKGCNKATTGCFKNFLKDFGMFPSPERDDPDSTPSTGNGGSSTTTNYNDPASVVIKYGADAGKTIKDLFDENPDKVEKMASATDKNGNPTWLANKAKAFLDSL